jgi:hypothetical protein
MYERSYQHGFRMCDCGNRGWNSRSQVLNPGPGGPEAAPGAGGPGVAQEVEQEAESSDVTLNFAVSNEGDYASQCTPASQFGQTGNLQNAPSFQQFDGEADDFEPGGIEFAAEPETAVECPSTIQQSAASD